eukprot:tig00020553_g10654.t1
MDVAASSANTSASRQQGPASDSSSSSTVPVDNDNIFKRFLSTVMITSVGSVGKLILKGLNRTVIFEEDKLYKYIEKRESGQSLLTVCNHLSFIDDPFLMATILPYRFLCRPRQYVRWSLCAEDMCFFNPLIGAFFGTGQVLPVKRGGGLDQKEIGVAVDKLKSGGWIHIFPEGRISVDGQLLPVRRGVGKLIYDTPRPPLVIPFYHDGMQRVLPLGNVLPSVGENVYVVIGDPIDFTALVEEHRRKNSPPTVVFGLIARRIEDELAALHKKCEEMKKTVSQ